jgi:hypothetical protein
MIKLKKLARTAKRTTSINPIAEFAAMRPFPDAPLMHMGQARRMEFVRREMLILINSAKFY